MKVVSKFKYGKNVYVIVLKNDKYKVGRLTGKVVNYNLTHDEKVLVTYVIGKLLPNNHKIHLLSTKVNGNLYDISVSNGIYEFSPIPNNIDLKVLNNLFNNQSECVYDKKSLRCDNNYIKRFVKLGKKTILVLLSSTFLLSSSSSFIVDIRNQFSDEIDLIGDLSSDKLIAIADEPYLEYDAYIDDKLSSEVIDEIQAGLDSNLDQEHLQDNITEEYNFNDIIEALRKNPKLTDTEKRHIFSCDFIFQDNFRYYNYQQLLFLLSTLDIRYINESYANIGGTYYNVCNLITIYNASRFEEADLPIFTHELSHMVQFTNKMYVKNYNEFLTEGTNVLANNEYYYEGSLKLRDCSYKFQQQTIRALSLIIGEDVFKRFYTFTDSTEILEELYKVYPNKERANRFIELLTCYQNYDSNVNHGNEELDQETIDMFKSNINQELKFYYEYKYNRSVDDDLLMLYYIDYDEFIDKVKIQYNLGETTSCNVTGIKERNFISSKNNDLDYTINIEANYIVDYEEESYEDCLNGGLINKDGTSNIEGLVIDKENNKVLRPQYRNNSIELVLNEQNRYLDDNFSR